MGKLNTGKVYHTFLYLKRKFIPGGHFLCLKSQNTPKT
nr:MAG TPA: hypothetical protein [Caudoviricetes sp.]